MIAIDTNILTRHIMQDDVQQSPLASDLLENRLTSTHPGLITIVALCEMSWVLKRVYGRNAEDVRIVVQELLDAPNLIVEHTSEVSKALSSTVEFSDALIHHISCAHGSERTLTFDKKFARLPGVELLS